MEKEQEKQHSVILDYMRSPEGRKSAEEFFTALALKKERESLRAARVNALSDEQFEKLMHRLIESHGDEWVDKCYNRGVEPHPSELLYLIFNTSSEFGKDISKKTQKEYSFPVQMIQYRGYQFFWLFGQGCHNRVYKGDEIVISL